MDPRPAGSRRSGRHAAARRSVAPEEVPEELLRLSKAIVDVERALAESQRALAVDPRVGSIFEVHRLLLGALRGEIEDAVRGGASAEHAVESILRRHAN